MQCSSNQVDEALRTDHGSALKAHNAETLEQLRRRCVESMPRHVISLGVGGNTVTMEFCHGNITDATCDAIVNAANETLEGGGGVDHIIHKVAGPQLREACLKQFPTQRVTRCGGALSVGDLARCQVGDAVITDAFGISPARYVIHTVAPLLDSHGMPQPLLLAMCYVSCLDAAEGRGGVTSVAFSSLGTGFYGYPQVAAAEVAIETCAAWVSQHTASSIRKIMFVTYGPQQTEVYELCFKLFK